MECCNTPDVTFPICTPTLAVSGVKLYLFFSGLGLCLRVLFSLSCISYHVIMCISFAYVFVSCIRAFSHCPFCIPALRSPPVVISSFLLCVGFKHFRIGPSLAKRPWFTTGKPPVKFRVIWTSFDTPTVNRGTEKASCVLHPNTPPIWPKTHQTLLHVLERSITIVWAKTAPHLDSPSSTYAYLYPLHSDLFFPRPKP